MEALRVELLDMADSLSHLGLWVKLHVPRAEDGNNFGVCIFEHRYALQLYSMPSTR